MEQVTISILTLLALYALYSECIKLPAIVKKNKKLCYALVIGLFFYYHQNNVVEGAQGADGSNAEPLAALCAGTSPFVCAILAVIAVVILASLFPAGAVALKLAKDKWG